MARPRDYGRGAGNHKLKVPRRECMCSREIPRVANCMPRAGNLVLVPSWPFQQCLRGSKQNCE